MAQVAPGSRVSSSSSLCGLALGLSAPRLSRGDNNRASLTGMLR